MTENQQIILRFLQQNQTKGKPHFTSDEIVKGCNLTRAQAEQAVGIDTAEYESKYGCTPEWFCSLSEENAPIPTIRTVWLSIEIFD
jgi:hypothetical protein